MGGEADELLTVDAIGLEATLMPCVWSGSGCCWRRAACGRWRKRLLCTIQDVQPPWPAVPKRTCVCVPFSAGTGGRRLFRASTSAATFKAVPAKLRHLKGGASPLWESAAVQDVGILACPLGAGASRHAPGAAQRPRHAVTPPYASSCGPSKPGDLSQGILMRAEREHRPEVLQ
jgi:hypothetical protein